MQIGFNDILAFVLEIFALIAFGKFGYDLYDSPAVLRWVLALAALALFALIWVRFFAPTANQRLTMPWLLIGKAVMLSLPVLTFLQAGKPLYALPYLALVAIHLTIGSRSNSL